MITPKHTPLIPFRVFIRKVISSLAIGLIIIILSLLLGITGYHHFAEMNWIDAYENAAMILSGMGPVDTLTSDRAKIFAGTYALFSGIIFLIVIAIIIAPIFHRFLHKFLIRTSE
jgi:hypothetical protein